MHSFFETATIEKLALNSAVKLDDQGNLRACVEDVSSDHRLEDVIALTTRHPINITPRQAMITHLVEAGVTSQQIIGDLLGVSGEAIKQDSKRINGAYQEVASSHPFPQDAVPKAPRYSVGRHVAVQNHESELFLDVETLRVLARIPQSALGLLVGMQEVTEFKTLKDDAYYSNSKSSHVARRNSLTDKYFADQIQFTRLRSSVFAAHVTPKGLAGVRGAKTIYRPEILEINAHSHGALLTTMYAAAKMRYVAFEKVEEITDRHIHTQMHKNLLQLVRQTRSKAIRLWSKKGYGRDDIDKREAEIYAVLNDNALEEFDQELQRREMHIPDHLAKLTKLRREYAKSPRLSLANYEAAVARDAYLPDDIKESLLMRAAYQSDHALSLEEQEVMLKRHVGTILAAGAATLIENKLSDVPEPNLTALKPRSVDVATLTIPASDDMVVTRYLLPGAGEALKQEIIYSLRDSFPKLVEANGVAASRSGLHARPGIDARLFPELAIDVDMRGDDVALAIPELETSLYDGFHKAAKKTLKYISAPIRPAEWRR